MTRFLLLLLFFIPSFSHGSVVPPQIPAQLVSTSTNTYHISPVWISLNSELFYNNENFCFTSVDPSYTNIIIHAYQNGNSPYLNTGTSSVPVGTFTGGSLTQNPVVCSDPSLNTNWLTVNDEFFFDLAPSTSLPVFVNVLYSSDFTSSASSTLIGYMKFRFDGTRWVDTLGAGSSGSWDFSTSTSLLPGDFSSFAQSIKDAIRNNSVVADCDFSDLFSSGFWSGCVATSIVNWLFVPSDSAIDYLVEQMASSQNYGSSFVYMLLMPIASAVSVTACDLGNASVCSVGSPLTIPILDVNGSSTDYVLDPVSPIPSYFDAFLASMLAIFILSSVSYVVLSKFL